MFARFFALSQLRRSTAFLLSRADDRLLDDIGLTRADLDSLRHDGFEVIAGGKAIAGEIGVRLHFDGHDAVTEPARALLALALQLHLGAGIDAGRQR